MCLARTGALSLQVLAGSSHDLALALALALIPPHTPQIPFLAATLVTDEPKDWSRLSLPPPHPKITHVIPDQRARLHIPAITL